MGGEKAKDEAAAATKRGSPPRGRGKARSLHGFMLWLRITPAWAGKSGNGLLVSSIPRDHPRVGGEKWSGPTRTFPAWGSPPRGRGKVVLHCGVLLDVGITPAWAGKSCRRCRNIRESWDHPRVGGEKLYAPVLAQYRSGSPPRGRGKGMYDLRWMVSQRITPAWAGKSLLNVLFLNVGEDHPRVGGEKLKSGPILWKRWGSPPRGRGKD